YWKGTLVNVPSVIHCCSSFVTFSIAFQANVAHLIRAGKLDTPCKASISSKPNCSASTSSPSIIFENSSYISNASCIGCPLTASVITEAAARLMEQPSPVKRTSSTTSPASLNCRKIRSPQVGLFISTVKDSSSSSPLSLVCL